jgi:hypothetical protein
MTISHKLIALGLAFSLFGSTCAFAKPTLEKEPVERHLPAANTSEPAGHVHHSSANPVKDDWPANMILGSYETRALG